MLSEIMVHSRRPYNTYDRKQIYNYYTQLNQRSFRDSKNPLIISEFYQNEQADYKEIELELLIKFEPCSKFFKKAKIFNDYIYIDVSFAILS